LFIGTSSRLGTRFARGCRRDLDGIAADATAARSLRKPLELVRCLVYGLQMALVLVPPGRRRDVWMPALGHASPSQLDVALLKRSLELQEYECLFDVEDLRHSRALR
jgi:hypothetical protein